MVEETAEYSSDRLRRIWRGEEPPARVRVEDLRSEAARRRRTMVLVLAGEVALTAGLIAWTVAILHAEGPTDPATIAWLAALWLSWLVASGFATWNRWGVWSPTAETTQGYLRLAEERARRRVRVAGFVLGLTAVQAVVLVGLGAAGVHGTIVVALYAGWAVWYRWKARRELAEIRRVAAELREADGEV